MMAVFGAVTGLLAAVGVWLAVAGLRKAPVTASDRRVIDVAHLARRGGAAAIGFVAVVAMTGWLAAGLLAAATVWVVPLLRDAARQREAVNERSEALASWAEMLRDSIAAHAGLREAIALTAPVAPAPIRSAVQSLAARAERQPLGAALRRFGVEVADPVADLVVASLVIAAEHQAQRLPDLLAQIASAAREQSSMRLRVETGRARTYASSRALVVITLGLAIGLLLFSPTFMTPYDSPTGQIVLTVIGAMFTGALLALVAMSRPALPPRLFAPELEVAVS